MPIEREQHIENTTVTTTVYAKFSVLNASEIGIWEMSQGVMRDIEAYEYFVVISCRGTIEVLDKGTPKITQELLPGSVVRLHDVA